ncbi:MAG: hypothetical protein LC808_27025 [Actinobacteria bacterium]|nr:hypothetical protein [Actinomycetota bacterium]
MGTIRRRTIASEVAHRAIGLVAVGILLASSGLHSPAKADQHKRGNEYRGLAAWVDIYDAWPYKHPTRVVRKMDRKRVRTLFLETGNYHSEGRVYRPSATSRLIEAAHRRGIRVVAWYLPGFARLKKDYRRAVAAIRFETEHGHRFDSFALDIEATIVEDIATRNRRLRRLARRLRHAVGPDYTMGAIVPEADALYWPKFPYIAVAREFDVFLPMAYFTFRTSGYKGVYDFISHNVRAIRAHTGDRSVPIHVIGGVAEDATVRETRAFVKAARDLRTNGASLYSFMSTTRRQWERLQNL